MDLPTTAAVVQDSPLQEILGNLLKGVASLVTLGVGWLVTQACLYLKNRTKIDVSDRVKKAVLDAAGVGIARGEEWGHQQIKKITALRLSEGPAAAEALVLPTGEEKQRIAKETASLISPEFSALDDKAKAAIMDAKLYQMRKVSLLPAVPGRSIMPSSSPPIAVDLSGREGTVPKAAPAPSFAHIIAQQTKQEGT